MVLVPELPFDIITEILSWLPVDSLLRFKCVCKKWCSLLLDYNFIAKHMVRASPLRLAYQQKWEHNARFPTTLYDANFKHLSSVAGLFLEESVNALVFRIRNFATHQVLYLPDAHEGTIRMGFTFDSSTLECKAASLYMERDYGHELGFKVLSIGKDDNWRTLKPPSQNDRLPRKGWTTYKKEGIVHLIELRDGKDLRLEVQSFEIWSECFTTTTLPRGAFSDLERVEVFCWNDHVAVADIVEESLNVLVLEEFKEHKWSKITVPLKFLKDNPELKDKIRPHRARLDDLMLYCAVENNLLVYDMKKGVIKATLTKSTKNLYGFEKPSLLTLKGMKNEY